jgi:hypothetical protein
MIKAENRADQKAVRLFDGSIKPKIIKSDKVVSIIVNSGKKMVRTYSVSVDKIVAINKNPIPLVGNPNVANKGLPR